MKLEKAIEILDEYDRFGAECTSPDLPDAVKLGRYALKAIRLQRQDPDNNYINVLPGETTGEEAERS